MQVLSTFELDELSVVAVGAGAQHSIVAAGDALFVWGNNEHGQLGCGEIHEKPVCAPMMLRWLENVTVTQLTCGDHHSIVVTNQSTVYAWGCNAKGQLGLGDLKLRSRPVRVDRLWGIPIVNVAAGGEHSLAVTTNGMLFTWGSNSHGQLGHPFNVEEAEEIHKRCATRCSCPAQDGYNVTMLATSCACWCCQMCCRIAISSSACRVRNAPALVAHLCMSHGM